MALCRDVNFFDYGPDKLGSTHAAVELSRLNGFNGPQVKGSTVTPQSCSGGYRWGLDRAYVSQFLLKPFAYGPYAMNGR